MSECRNFIISKLWQKDWVETNSDTGKGGLITLYPVNFWLEYPVRY